MEALIELIDLRIDGDPLVELNDVLAPMKSPAVGEPKRLIGRNKGSKTIKDFAVKVEGEGKDHVQLATDRLGGSGIWADAGGEILIAQFLDPRDGFAFWARGLFGEDDYPDDYDFEFVFAGTALG